jgi:hypothetical protein
MFKLASRVNYGVMWTCCAVRPTPALTVSVRRRVAATVRARFTIAQLSLAVNAGIGIWVFHAPPPGTRQARRVLAAIVLAGMGGCTIAAMR